MLLQIKSLWTGGTAAGRPVASCLGGALDNVPGLALRCRRPGSRARRGWAGRLYRAQSPVDLFSRAEPAAAARGWEVSVSRRGPPQPTDSEQRGRLRATGPSAAPALLQNTAAMQTWQEEPDKSEMGEHIHKDCVVCCMEQNAASVFIFTDSWVVLAAVAPIAGPWLSSPHKHMGIFSRCWFHHLWWVLSSLILFYLIRLIGNSNRLRLKTEPSTTPPSCYVFIS